MFSKVLVGVDFRPSGRDAIALAARLCDGDGTLALAHAYPGRYMPSHAITPGLVREDRERAEAKLEQERAEANVDAELIVRQGPTPGRVLHETAEERDADLLVLGSCRRGIFGRAMLGDDTRASIDGAPCAVAVAPVGYAEHPSAIGKIGVAYDGSPESRAALDVGRGLAASHGATIHALHVVSVAAYPYAAVGAMLLAEINERVERADTAMKALEGVDGRAEYGLPAEDLADFGNEVDLLIVGSRGYGPWGRLVHGSTSARLARHVRCPLLIVPRVRRPEGGQSESAESRHAAISA